jgi:hypothetical protein
MRIVDRTPLGRLSIVFGHFDSSKFSSRSFSFLNDGKGLEFHAHGEPLAEEIRSLGEPATAINSDIIMQICSAFGMNIDVDPGRIGKCIIFTRK